MSIEIPTAFVKQYGTNVQLLLQQTKSKLAGTTMTAEVKGKIKFTDQIGPVMARERTARHGDTPLVSTPHRRRAYSTKTQEIADLIDDADKVRLLIDPTSAYTINMVRALLRVRDIKILSAAIGTARAGEEGTDTIALPAGQKVAKDYVESGSPADSGLTTAKLRAARTKLRRAEIPEDEPLYLSVGARQIDDLLRETEPTSADFATVKALQAGTITEWMGFHFRHTEYTPWLLGTTMRKVVAWARSGIELGIGKEIKTRVSERDDKSYSTQVYAAQDVGAVRLQEEQVVEISCVDADGPPQFVRDEFALHQMS